MGKKEEKAQQFSLKKWIDERGNAYIAKLFGVDVSTVNHWRRGHCLPRPEQMYRISQLTDGALSCENMIAAHMKRAKKTKNPRKQTQHTRRKSKK